jgi:succinyl-CoA synthetase beta subunit
LSEAYSGIIATVIEKFGEMVSSEGGVRSKRLPKQRGKNFKRNSIRKSVSSTLGQNLAFRCLMTSRSHSAADIMKKLYAVIDSDDPGRNHPFVVRGDDRMLP